MWALYEMALHLREDLKRLQMVLKVVSRKLLLLTTTNIVLTSFHSRLLLSGFRFALPVCTSAKETVQ